uniref:J domain-containing protein n=1 Tax=viral metagenome TaxID=1070528 RepID=A0A6C0EDI0_9ZZZZ
MESSEPHIVLGISKNATKIEIRNAFRKLSLKYHPDKGSKTQDKFIQIKNAYEKMMEKFEKKEQMLNEDIGFFDFYKSISEKMKQNVNYLNITNTYKCSLKDKYMCKTEDIEIERYTKPPFRTSISLGLSYIIFDKDGETKDGRDGEIILVIESEPDPRFIVNNFDLHTTVEIGMYEYCYGGQFLFTHIDDTEIFITHDSLLGDNEIVVECSGLPVTDETGAYGDARGDLIIHVKIKKIEDPMVKKRIKNIYD